MDGLRNEKNIYQYSNDELSVEKNMVKIRIIHFNDVYNIENRNADPCGGASRFIFSIKQIIEEEPTLVMFSGDAFAPSTLSSIHNGKQMLEILNRCHIDVACLGNHDFDFGLDVLDDLVKKSNFPWLLSNIVDNTTNQPLVGSHISKIIQIKELKIGVIGIVEKEWIATLTTLDFDNINYTCYIESAKHLSKKLKENDQVDMIIALTHMRSVNDRKLIEKVPEIDLVLGGHDHDYEVEKIGDRWLIKSGTDFRDFSLIEIGYDTSKLKSHVTKLQRFSINLTIPEDIETKQIVEFYMKGLNDELETVLCEINTDLDGRFSIVRTQESNLGNLFCDIALGAVHADCCIMNSGTFRSDSVHPKGEFKIRDLKIILPYMTGIIVMKIKGNLLYEALENSVSKFPAFEGRFPQVSGISFEFDPSKPSGNRINPNSIFIQNKQIDMNKDYKLATNTFLLLGKDGYTMLQSCPLIVDVENCSTLFSIIENYFVTIKKLKEDKANRSKCPLSLAPLCAIDSIITQLSTNPRIFYREYRKNQPLSFKLVAMVIYKTVTLKHRLLSREDRMIIKSSIEFDAYVSKYEKKAMELAPIVEGRIRLKN